MGVLEKVERAKRFLGDPPTVEIGKNVNSNTLN